jgi:hypothetical protein
VPAHISTNKRDEDPLKPAQVWIVTLTQEDRQPRPILRVEGSSDARWADAWTSGSCLLLLVCRPHAFELAHLAQHIEKYGAPAGRHLGGRSREAPKEKLALPAKSQRVGV